ncbi:Spy/CpxP family protein refolding chaperone [Enterovirga rhinocerotis]|uniref:LTXXQ motif family protein n=1 Tax=Enterovirga rhinocerotis TaxID=1339210 RepID=A0A4R7C4T1_9HYPH|nr:Spy/CpxP family protein refolding chaperone [Enterovirga rhinocerotis]TDR93398.1 LTXXQ motif family protein [Enterovirga rhinocerotis]
MKKVVVGLALGLAAGAASLAVAQERAPASPGGAFERGGKSGFTQEDRSAFLDGRIAGMKAGLKLTAEQDKLWPPVETALRDMAREREEARAARRESWASFRESKAAGKAVERDPIASLRARSERMAKSAASMGKLADAAAPLYATLDEGQKRRLGALMVRGQGGPHGKGHGPRHGHGPR